MERLRSACGKRTLCWNLLEYRHRGSCTYSFVDTGGISRVKMMKPALILTALCMVLTFCLAASGAPANKAKFLREVEKSNAGWHNKCANERKRAKETFAAKNKKLADKLRNVEFKNISSIADSEKRKGEYNRLHVELDKLGSGRARPPWMEGWHETPGKAPPLTSTPETSCVYFRRINNPNTYAIEVGILLDQDYTIMVVETGEKLVPQDWTRDVRVYWIPGGGAVTFRLERNIAQGEYYTPGVCVKSWGVAEKGRDNKDMSCKAVAEADWTPTPHPITSPCAAPKAPGRAVGGVDNFKVALVTVASELAAMGQCDVEEGVFSKEDYVVILVDAPPVVSMPWAISAEASMYKASRNSGGPAPWPLNQLQFSPVPGATNVKCERRSAREVLAEPTFYGTNGHIPPGIYFLSYWKEKYDLKLGHERGYYHRLALGDGKNGFKILSPGGKERVYIQFHEAYNDLAKYRPDISEGCITITNENFGRLFQKSFMAPATSPLNHNPQAGKGSSRYTGKGNILVFVTDVTDVGMSEHQKKLFEGVLSGFSDHGLTKEMFSGKSAQLTALRKQWMNK